jgi:hypothetical protein
MPQYLGKKFVEKNEKKYIIPDIFFPVIPADFQIIKQEISGKREG